MKNVCPKRVFSLDEAGFCEKDAARLYGYGKRGVKVHGYISGKRSTRHNIVGMLNSKNKIIAWQGVEGTMNAEKFNTYLRWAIKKLPKYAVIIMDNARFHVITPTTQARLRKKKIEIRFLPPYSPHLNPIERAWAWSKAWLKKHASKVCSFAENLRAALVNYEKN